jgi:hypothetical protein
MEAVQHVAELFLSRLDRKQTKLHFAKNAGKSEKLRKDVAKRLDATAAFYEYVPPLAGEVESRFRHGRWWQTRKRVKAALEACKVPRNRLWRFESCGADAFIDYDADSSRHRVRAFHCGDRFCIPCMQARSKKVQEEIVKMVGNETPLFITLTRRADGTPLAKIISQLYRSFAKLRRSKIWKNRVDAGAAVMEIKRGKFSGQWHVHLHCICIGRYLKKTKLVRAWRRASRGSFVVDVQRVKENGKSIGYVAAYAGKGFDKSVLQNHDDLCECVLALRSRRLFCTFGKWRGIDLEGIPEPRPEWKPIGRLELVAAECIRGSAFAVGIFKSLGLVAFYDPSGHIQIQRVPDEAKGKARPDDGSG